MKTYWMFAIALILSGSSCAKMEEAAESPYLEKARETLRNSKSSLGGTNETMQTVKELYQKAKEAGEEVPNDVMDWAKQDIKRIGAWQYRIEVIESTDPDTVLQTLNALGSQRWECFWVEEVNAVSKRYYFKKSSRSYLRLIPSGDLLKLIPQGDGGGQ